MKNESVIVETLIGIFTVEHSEIKILLSRKKTEPYKGYWTLLGSNLKNGKTLEENILDTLIEQTSLSEIEIEQCHAFSDLDRGIDERKIAITFIGLIDSVTVNLKSELLGELNWFSLDNIPKAGYDHDIIIEKMVETLRKKLVNSNTLKTLFPSDFTLPELQRIYEQILDRELDRRNFRKKFIAMDLIEDTGDKNEGYNGRPAKLYRFKETLKERDLF